MRRKAKAPCSIPADRSFSKPDYRTVMDLDEVNSLLNDKGSQQSRSVAPANCLTVLCVLKL